MKIMMYHYVREHTPALPHFRYLHVENFRRQLDWLESQFGFADQQAFLDSVATGKMLTHGAVLTFDDGFVDHYAHVMPELVRRGLWGLFYIPMSVYLENRLLDVHRVHLLLGAHGDKAMANCLEQAMADLDIPQSAIDRYAQTTYETQKNSAESDRFRKTLNYFFPDDTKREILDRIEEQYPIPETARSFYLTQEQMVEMRDNGMLIGNHGHRHLVYSKIPPAAVEADIVASDQALNDLLPGLSPKHFCYAFGVHSCTPQARGLLTSLSYQFAFSLGIRDLEPDDLTGDRMALPRHPCHLFPHGQAHLGATPPQE